MDKGWTRSVDRIVFANLFLEFFEFCGIDIEKPL